MSRIIFEINYEVKPEKRDEYLSLIKELKNHLVNMGSIEHIVVADKKNENNFTEIYICENEEQYESLEENTDDKAYEMTQKLYKELIVDGKANYNTYKEIE